ncbi:DUF6159 family protein [Natrialba taiwanensis]|uniref:Glycerophosphoryl diester phosphodiesterase membrane domain-containing protein n=1 Tax=Natrialba taiwanensis DSM 12281 TaxID=1230458 RepID=L9ZT95_9EURY|nr:DUF6159 family protein [Natrialba taiwanensis]ELY88403.1 hypothetical protein C484_15857 [Natrialba taiwanensis DSM 12281]
MVLQSVFARFRTGFEIAKASFGVLRREKWLLAFPVLYGASWLVGLIGLVGGIVAALFGVGYGMALLEQVTNVSPATADTAVTATLVAAAVGFMFVATSIATFFSAALVHAVGTLFTDEPTGIRAGLAGAWESRRTILAWGVVGAAVGLLFRALESQDGLPAQIIRSVAGFAWFAMTFFIVPVIVFQDGSVRESMRESVGLFRETWGQVGGINLGVGLVLLPPMILTGLAGIGLPVFVLDDPWSVLAFTLVPTLLVLGALMVIYQAATGVAKTALYQYAREGTLPPEFDGIDPDTLTRSSGPTSALNQPPNQKPGQI